MNQVSPTKPRSLRAEVISIGDEMTSGARLDTNAQWLSHRLGELGIEVAFHSTVGDTLQDNFEVFRIAARRADIVISTGGLGPTQDDLTRKALAAVVDRPLEISESALAHIESMFARRQREMPHRNRVQAMFPVGSREIFNPQGTAPGVDMDVSREHGPPSRIFALPGVPAEMKRMFHDTVAPRILEASGGHVCIRQNVMKLFGTGESDMEERLGDMIARDRQPRVGITVSAATISLRITATAETEEECIAMIAATRQEVFARAGEFYFGDGENFEQYHAIDESLKELGQSLVVIELGQAAPLGDWFASLGETSSYRGGLSLCVSDDILRLGNASDVPTALTALRQQFAAQWLLMVDRYPSLDASSDQPMPAAEVALTVVDPSDKAFRTTIVLGGHPDILQARIAKAAMQWLRKIIAKDQPQRT
tara:strand:+ start:161341 stop:162612 length:1272 start_codon:yes stop_codon:yes gene_type:complete